MGNLALGKVSSAMAAMAKEPMAIRRTYFKLVVDFNLREIIPRLRELGYIEIASFGSETPLPEMDKALNAMAAARPVNHPVVIITRKYEEFENSGFRRNYARYVALLAKDSYPAAKIPAKVDIAIQHRAMRFYGGVNYDLAWIK